MKKIIQFSLFPTIILAIALSISFFPETGRTQIANIPIPPGGGTPITATSTPIIGPEPILWTTRIVWQDYRHYNLGNSWDIYMYDLSTKQEYPIDTSPNSSEEPKIYGNKIVWEVTGSGAVYMYNILNGEKTKIGKFGASMDPDISGNRIVWSQVNDSKGFDIYMYDISTGQESQIDTGGKSYKQNPDINGNIIVWDERTDWYGKGDIYMYDLSTKQKKQITKDGDLFNQYDPAIYGDKIVWTDTRNNSQDIFMYNLSTGKETQITKNEGINISPAIWGNKIVWHKWGTENDGIFLYNIATGKKFTIATGKATKKRPDIYGTKIVWEDARNDPSGGGYEGFGNWDIYMYDLYTGQEKQITNVRYGQQHPAIFSPILLPYF